MKKKTKDNNRNKSGEKIILRSENSPEINWSELSLRAHRKNLFEQTNDRTNVRMLWFRMNRFFTSTNCIKLSAGAFSGDFKVVKIALKIERKRNGEATNRKDKKEPERNFKRMRRKWCEWQRQREPGEWMSKPMEWNKGKEGEVRTKDKDTSKRWLWLLI